MIDMREIKPGCAIDEFHFEMWAGFLRFMLLRDEIRKEFEVETGAQFDRPDKTFDPYNWMAGYVARFAVWVTPLYWGGPEDICPAIAEKLAASGMPLSENNEDCSRPKAGSPVGEAETPKGPSS